MLLPRETRIGTAGWSYQDWVGKVYPRLRPRSFHQVEYLARYFDTLEVNSSFYRPVRPEHARVWATRVAFNQHFMFTAKLHRSFTHDRTGGETEEREFRAMADVLAESGRLGAVLAQFPWSFKHTRENRIYLSDLLERFSSYPLVVEMRHSEWMSRPFLELLKERGVGFCNVDQPTLSRGMEATSLVTARTGYIRLHGRNYKSWFTGGESENRHERYNYLYSPAELEPWRKRVEQVSAEAEATYVIANNHYQGKAAANALELISMLLGKRVEAPLPLVEAYPELEAFTNAGRPAQEPLFTG